MYSREKRCLHTLTHAHVYTYAQERAKMEAAEKKIFFAGLSHAADQRKPAKRQRI